MDLDEKYSKLDKIEKARQLKLQGKPLAVIAEKLGISESEAREIEIDWGFNCLIGGIHHGRPEAIWNIPLGYAVVIFRRHILKDLVITRIYNDALQFVDYNDKYTQEWAERTRQIAEERYDTTLQTKVGELSKYYKTPGWELEQQEAARRVSENKLNPGYEPLHGHDTINLLCRILGTGAEAQARRELESK